MSLPFVKQSPEYRMQFLPVLAFRILQLIEDRDNIGNEVDLILDHGIKVMPVEIKLGKTMNEDFLKGLRYYKKLNPKKSLRGHLIYGGSGSFSHTGFDIVSYKDIANRFS